MPASTNEKTTNDSLRPLWVLLVIVFGVQVLAGLAIYFSPLEDWSERGTFGDMFGAVNTLFSGLAFAGVIYAILLQRQELSLQRKELELTRRELEKSAKAQERSAGLLEQQLGLMVEQLQLAQLELEPKLLGGSLTRIQEAGETAYKLVLHFRPEPYFWSAFLIWRKKTIKPTVAPPNELNIVVLTARLAADDVPKLAWLKFELHYTDDNSQRTKIDYWVRSNSELFEDTDQVELDISKTGPGRY